MRLRLLSAPVILATAACLFLSSTSLAWLDPAQPDVVTVPDSQDTDFSYGTAPQSGSWSTVHGSAGSIGINGWWAVAGLKFDLSAHRGKIVQEAELHLAKTNNDPNYSLVAGTMNTDWTESSACWRYKATSTDWTFPYSDFSTAAFGNYGTLVSFAYATNGDYGTYPSGGKTWIRANLDPAVVQALVLGDQYGLAVTDARICYHSNANGTTYATTVYSKDAGSATQPKLLIRFATGTDTSPPNPVTNLTAAAGLENGEVVLRFLAPTDPQADTAFGYTVRYSTGSSFSTATDVERWHIPRPATPGTPQRVLIQNLTAGTTYSFFVQAYDSTGNGGTVQSVSFAVPAAVATPSLVNGSFVTPSASGKTVRNVSGVLRYWAASEVAKVNPVSGYVYGGSANDDYKKANAVWDSATNTISLLGCRNEVVGAQLLIEKSGSALSNIHVTVSDLAGPAGNTIPASTSIELFLEHYVLSGGNYYPEAAIPLAPPFPTSFAIPDANHNPSSQAKNQGIWMDIWVPKGVAAGDYTGTVTVTANELSTPVTINLRVRVSAVMIPDYPTFLVDLNGYTMPIGGSFGNQWDFGNVNLTCLRYFQTAHKHRAMCNTLPYKQAGWTAADRGPVLSGAGPTLHASDWSVFDAKYGRFFDGTAFSPTNPDNPYYGPGQNTPVTHLYTIFSEYWPMPIMDPTYGWDATTLGGHGGEYWNYMVDEATLGHTTFDTYFSTMPDVFAGFTEGYKQGVRNVVADWFQHAHEKGWTRTSFETFFNDKYYYNGNGDCKALWLLEENESADDFRAVGFFNQLYREGQRSGVTDVPWHFRIDISTRFCQHWGQLTNRVNYQNVGSSSADWHFPNIKYRGYAYDEDKQEQWIWYGLGTGVTSSTPDHSRIFLQQWCRGLDGGILYWDNFVMAEGANSMWNVPHSGGLVTLYSGQNIPGFGQYDGPIASLRLKMMRQGQQMVEMVNLWSERTDMNRPRARNGLYAKHGSGTWDYRFNTWNENKVYQVRADLIAQLEGSLPVAPSNPSPSNGTGNMPIATTLSWSGAASGVTFDVYLDTANPPVAKVATGQTAASFIPSLQSGLTYYWQVVANNNVGSTAGPVWMFVVAGPPPVPGNPDPGNNQLNVPANPTLSWNGGVGTPGVTFDVRLDTANPPVATVTADQSAATFAASSLLDGRRYYWQVIAKTSAGQTPGPVWSFTTRLLGDANGDGYVNVGDLQLLVTAWGSNDSGSWWNWNPDCDFNKDGYINVGDLQILVANWARSVQ